MDKKKTPVWNTLMKIAVVTFCVSMFAGPVDTIWLTLPVFMWGVLAAFICFVLAIAFGIVAALSRRRAQADAPAI